MLFWQKNQEHIESNDGAKRDPPPSPQSRPVVVGAGDDAFEQTCSRRARSRRSRPAQRSIPRHVAAGAPGRRPQNPRRRRQPAAGTPPPARRSRRCRVSTAEWSASDSAFNRTLQPNLLADCSVDLQCAHANPLLRFLCVSQRTPRRRARRGRRALLTNFDQSSWFRCRRSLRRGGPGS